MCEGGEEEASRHARDSSLRRHRKLLMLDTILQKCAKPPASWTSPDLSSSSQRPPLHLVRCLLSFLQTFLCRSSAAASLSRTRCCPPRRLQCAECSILQRPSGLPHRDRTSLPTLWLTRSFGLDSIDRRSSCHPSCLLRRVHQFLHSRHRRFRQGVWKQRVKEAGKSRRGDDDDDGRGTVGGLLHAVMTSS